MDFGKLDFSVAFNPTSAFPLDARYYFDSLESAQQAAANAVEVGKLGTYYIGENLVVVSNNNATLYVITPERTLQALNVSSDNLSIDVNKETGRISLKGLDNANEGQTLRKASNGGIEWVTMTNSDKLDEIHNMLIEINNRLDNLHTYDESLDRIEIKLNIIDDINMKLNSLSTQTESVTRIDTKINTLITQLNTLIDTISNLPGGDITPPEIEYTPARFDSENSTIFVDSRYITNYLDGYLTVSNANIDTTDSHNLILR